MKISKRDSADERRVLTGMIVDSIVLANIADKWDGQLFNSRWSNLIAKWCVDFHRRYEKAPGTAIEGLFESWAQGSRDGDTVKLVEKFLSHLSGEYEELLQNSNSDYLIDRAAEHFNRVRVDRLRSALEGDIDANQVNAAVEKVQKFDRLEMGQGSAVDVLQDQQAIRDAFERRSEALIEYPGALKNFFGTSLERDGFIAFMGPEKRGKCVSGDMVVQLANGSRKTIRELVHAKEPVKVMSYNENSHQMESADVSQFWDNGNKRCIGVRTKSGRYVETTTNHKYLTPDGWKEIGDVECGDFIAVPKLMSCSGTVAWDEVVSIVDVGIKDTYDLTVPGNENFSCNEVIVHNTFWLMDVAWRAVLQRRRVAFFAVGDMSQDQMLRRFAVRACRRPLDARKIKYPKQLVKDPSQDIAEPLLIEKEYTKPLSWRKAWKTFEETCHRRIKSTDPYLRMSVHPNSSINVAGIKSIVSGWERRGWVPDVIVIDYADILAPPAGSGDESRNQTNATWKQLRALSQSLHCLVVTATQSDAQSYSVDTVRRSHFSEDKRKLAHVTGLVGLNATEPETELGVMRLNWIVLRESKFSESQCVHVAGCLSIANPALLSTF